MARDQVLRLGRRRMLQGSLALASGSVLAGCANQVAPFFSTTTGGQLETTRIRMYQVSALCVAPQYLASDLLRAEGFTDIQYVQLDSTRGTDPIYSAFATGDIDLSMAFVGPFIMQVDQGAPVVLLGGVHVGCFEVFGNDSVRAIRDLKGKIVGLGGIGSAPHLFLASVAAYVGLDPRVDITWRAHSPDDT